MFLNNHCIRESTEFSLLLNPYT